MLSQKYGPDALRSIILPRADWRPFPAASEREPWEAMDDSVSHACIAAGEEALDFAWPPLPATRFLDYARVGYAEGGGTCWVATAQRKPASSRATATTAIRRLFRRARCQKRL